MRQLSVNTQAKVDTLLATEPIIIIQIDWVSGTEYYGYKTFTLGTWNVQGSINSFSSISSQGKQDSTGEISSVGVTLDDSDGSLKTKVDTEIIEGKICTIYHHYEGNSQSDVTTILKGRIAGDITWLEGERTLEFDIESYIEVNNIGYAPEEGDFSDLWGDAEGVTWPFSFGTVLNVPAVRVKNRPIGKLIYGINQNFSTFKVENGDEFPQGSSINLLIGQIKYTGTFSGETFTISTQNDAYHTNIAIGDRPLADSDYFDASVLWLQYGQTENLKGLYCIINHSIYGWMVNKCIAQDGRKCWFIKPWRPTNTVLEIKIDSSSIIAETAPIPRGSWAETFVIENLAIYFETLTSSKHNEVRSLMVVLADHWSIRAGTEVNQEVSYSNLYVVNLIPSIEILDVFGYRNFDGEKIFAPIPQSYYIKNLSDTLGAQNPTTLEFPIALEDYIDEEWEGDVYVSYRSTKGPNAASIIKYLLETYTSFSIDPVSFAAVELSLNKYPANFTIFNQPDALAICEDIAWQSRCALFIKGDTVYIKYLSVVPAINETLTESEVLLKTMQLAFSTTEDIYTRINATWKKNYSEEENVEREYIYSNNINNYGLREFNKDFFIYNIESLVILSAGFWGYRYSNSWRHIALDTPLKTLALENFDAVDYELDILSSNNIIGVLDLVNHNAVDNVIHLEAELASKAGDVDGGNNPIEDSNYFTGSPSNPVGPSNPMPGDVGDGLEEIEYEVPTQGQTDSDPDSDPASDPSGTGPGVDPTYYLKFTTEPNEVQRGVNFTLTVQTWDYQDNKVSHNISATLNLQSTDGSDVLSTTNINIVNGEWSSSSMQITGGSSSDTGIIAVAASGYTGDNTETFNIIPPKVNSLSWATTPATVSRAVAISNYTLSGGLVGELVNISLNSADPLDKLYDSSGVEITQITLGAGGTYTFSGTYISGGSGSDFGTITADDVLEKYDDKQTSQFTISGLSPVSVINNIVFSQVAEANGDYLQLAKSGPVLDDYEFELSGSILQPDESIATSYNETLRIEAYDYTGGGRLTWLAVGPNAANYGGFIYASIVNGVWSFDGMRLEIPGGTDGIRFTAEVVGKETQFNDEIITDIWLTLTSLPVARGKHISQTIGGKIYTIWGDAAGLTNSVVIYDIASDTWSYGTSGGEARIDPCSALWNSKIYMIGGYDGSTNLQTDLWVYNTVTNTWDNTKTGPGSIGVGYREGPIAVATGGHVYVWGEVGSDPEYKLPVDYNIGSDTWTSTRTQATSWRQQTAAVVYNNIIYIWVHDRMQTYNINTDTWNTILQFPVARYNNTASLLGDKIFFHGGSLTLNGTPVSDTYIYDISLNTYSLLPISTYNIKNHASVIYNNELYIIGGNTGSGNTATMSKIYVG